MRISTEYPTPRERRRAKPGVAARVFFALFGAAFGGLVGYGLVTASPGAHPFDSGIALWIGVPAVVLSIVGYVFPRAFLRPGGRFRWYHGTDDE